MKRFILFWVAVAVLCFGFMPSVRAMNYLSVHDANNLWLKAGSTSAPWVPIANSPSGFNNIGETGDRFAYIDGNQNLWMKQGANGQWALVARNVYDADIYNDLVAVIDTAHNLYIKQGPLNSGWIFEAGGAYGVKLGENRIAVLDNYFSTIGKIFLEVKEGGLNAPWIFEADIAAPTYSGQVSWPEIQISKNRIAYLSGDFSEFFIKEGSLFNSWQANISNPNYTFYYLMNDSRLCVNITASSFGGPDQEVYCKDGSLNTPWALVHDNAYLEGMTSTQVGVRSFASYDPTNALRIFSGPVFGGSWTGTLDQGLALWFN